MALREVLASFGFDIEQPAIDKADGSVNKLTTSFQTLGKVLAGGALVLGAQRLFAFASEAAVATDEMDKFAQAIGLNAREVAEWDQTFQDAGLTLEEGRAGIKDGTKNIGEAIGGNEGFRKSLRLLGADLKDSNGQFRSQNDILTDAILGLNNIDNAAKKLAIAEQLFGGASGGFIRVAEGGRDALEAVRKEFAELNPDFEQQVESAKAAAVAMDGWRKSSDAARNRLAAALIPTLTRLIEAADRAVRFILDLTKNTRILEVGLVALAAVAAAAAGAILVAFAPVIAPVAAVAAVIFGLILVAEDLFQLFTGGKSVIGGLIDQFFGFGAASDFVRRVRRAWEDLLPVLQAFWDLIRLVFPIWLRWISLVARNFVFLWRQIFRAAGGIVSGVKKIFEGIQSAWETVTSKIRELWDTTFDAVRSSIKRIEEFLEPVISRIEGVIDAARGVAGLFGDDGVSPNLALDLRGAESGGLPIRSTPRESPRVQVNQGPTTIQVNGAAAPDEVAQRVMRAMDDREQSAFRRARDRLRGR